MPRLRTALLALFLISPALAQQSSILGLEVRSPERDQVLGEVVGVQGNRAIIQLEARDRPVAVELDRLQRAGNKLTLPMSEDELAQLPPADVEAAVGEAPVGAGAPSDLPMGGTTPGWGTEQGGWTPGGERR